MSFFGNYLFNNSNKKVIFTMEVIQNYIKLYTFCIDLYKNNLSGNSLHGNLILIINYKT